MNIGLKHISLPRRGILARGSEWPGKDAKVVVGKDPDNLEAIKTSLCLCLNSADGSGDRNQSSFVPSEEMKTAQEVTPGWGPASFPPPKTHGAPWHVTPLLILPWQATRLWTPVPLLV